MGKHERIGNKEEEADTAPKPEEPREGIACAWEPAGARTVEERPLCTRCALKEHNTVEL